MVNKGNVVVSHPGKQYVHQLLYALQKESHLQLFITSIWYKPSLSIYKLLVHIPVIGKFLFEKFLKKKQYPFQHDELIEQHPWNEFKRQLLVQFSTAFRNEKYVFEVEKSHDKIVAKRLEKLKPDIFIGYEKSSLESFKAVKKYGGITVLDLAQVHYKYLEQLKQNEPTFQNLFEDDVLFKSVNLVKAAEYQYADYILALSSFAKKTLTDNGISENRIKVLNLGYNPQIFTKKTSYNQNHPGLKLIYTGTFTRRKGIELLLLSIKELNLPNLELTIIGPILDGKELFEQYKNCFTYYDFLHHEELVKHLQASDVFVFPSYLDSWAMTVVEAMACGLPVIVTESTGAKDAIENGDSGFIIPTGDIKQLKEKIVHFYNNKSLIELMGNNAAEAAFMYSWKNYYIQVDNFIKEL